MQCPLGPLAHAVVGSKVGREMFNICYFFIGTLTGLFFNIFLFFSPATRFHPETSISEVFFDDSIISGTPRFFSKTTGEKVF